MGLSSDHDHDHDHDATQASGRKRKRNLDFDLDLDLEHDARHEHHLLVGNATSNVLPTTSNSSPAVRRVASSKSTFGEFDNDDGGGYVAETMPKKRRTKRVDAQPPPEKRLRRYRPKPPQSFDDIYLRATTQRFYVLGRTRCGTPSCPEEQVELTGSTGNIYHVHIARQPSCDCPHAAAGNQCKHLVYVMARVLRARHDHVYQLALLSTELQDIFANAPPPMGDDDDPAGTSTSDSKHRKPVEGDCPICFNELDPAKEDIVWCRAACGQNIHKECFGMWAATKRQNTGREVEVTCPFCRSQWQGDDDMVRKIKKTGRPNEEGYVNVADQLGISKHRDTSTYSRWWSGHAGYYGRRRY